MSHSHRLAHLPRVVPLRERLSTRDARLLTLLPARPQSALRPSHPQSALRAQGDSPHGRLSLDPHLLGHRELLREEESVHDSDELL